MPKWGIHGLKARMGVWGEATKRSFTSGNWSPCIDYQQRYLHNPKFSHFDKVRQSVTDIHTDKLLTFTHHIAILRLE